jgi:hypothetical protein
MFFIIVSVLYIIKTLPKLDVPKLILTLFAMEHLQSTALLIQSICFFQLVTKLSLLSTPMSQSAHSHTMLALTWTSTPESRFWLEESQYTSLRYHLVEILRQFIGQDLAALELCFDNQKDFNDYTTKNFNWKYAMCHLYIVYYRFLNDYPIYVYSGLPWTTICNECTKWRRWLDSDEANCPQMIIRQAHSGKKLCRHIVKPLTLMTTQSPHQTVFIQLKMIEKKTSINPFKTTWYCPIVSWICIQNKFMAYSFILDKESDLLAVQ